MERDGVNSEHAPEHFRDWNEEMVKRYDPEVFHHHPRSLVRWVERKRVQTVLRCLEASPAHSILEVGCGAGNILAQLQGGKRCGVDLSRYMIGRAQERIGTAASLIQGDAERLPFADASFDRVIASSLFSHALHPENIVPELHRVTKPGGRVVISISHEEQIERGIRWVRMLRLEKYFFGNSKQSERQKVYNIEYHLHRFSPRRLRETVGKQLTELGMHKVPAVFPVHLVFSFQRNT